MDVMPNNNSSMKLMRALVAVLTLLLFLSGIFMVSEKGGPEKNKKWFGVAYIVFAGLIGIFYVYANVMSV
jgi:heme/copper-type cytochrome/quinol oxidase subunit 3